MKKLFFLTALLSICSCTVKQSEYDLVKTFQDKGILYPKEVKTCIIIPEGGCGGCIAAGISFIQDNKSSFSKAQQNNVVVFTKIHSMKLLKRQLGDVTIESLNSIVDTMRIYSIDTKDGIYPIILYLDGGDIKSVDVASPKTDAFEQLKKRL
ncbi:MAG: hypothetical protein Q4F85_15845 [Prevotella sp.]|nr:hypothetical protein [Prevotella sp.]